MQGLPERIKNDRLNVITIHSPEFEHEKDVLLLQERVGAFGLNLPVYIDNDLGYFRALQSEGWPNTVLVDKKGRIRFIYLGETHANFAQARKIEKHIQDLLNE